MRRRLQITQLQKQKNRLKFGTTATEEYLYTGEDFGMIGKSGKLRIKI